MDQARPNLLLDKIIRSQAILEAADLLRRRQSVTPLHSARIESEKQSGLGGDAKATYLSDMMFELDGCQYLNFSSNDYLGLSRSLKLIEAQYRGAQIYGVGSGSSPLVTGYSQAHVDLEQGLCQATGHEAGIIFSSGFSANHALMTTLFASGERVLADKLVHASLIDGLIASQAKLSRFLHNDMASAETLLLKHAPLAVITESIFSMDGDSAPLHDLSRLCKAQGCWLIVDDAHGFGLHTDNAVNASVADIQVVTFGKALGCQGAAILGSQQLIDFLVANAREYIYSTALSPANATLALAAVERVQCDLKPLKKLNSNIAYFKKACELANIALSDSQGPIQPLIIGDVETTMSIARQLKQLGLWVGAIRPPTVPKGSARLRITLTALHSHQDIDKLVSGLTLTGPRVVRVKGATEALIAERFSMAAKGYRQHDKLQQLSMNALFKGMSPSGVLLDIGAGPGTNFSQFSAVENVIALDIAQGMLSQVKTNFPHYHAICGNAERLPVQDSSVDVAYSNLALQWCSNLAASIDETARVLKSGGQCHFAIVAQASLSELEVLGFRVNAFAPLETMLAQFDSQIWQISLAEVASFTVYFADLKTLLYSIKGVGASIDDEQASTTVTNMLRGRGDWLSLQARAEQTRTKLGLPLTYQIAQIRAIRK